MTGDARFADGAERPLRLRALDAADLTVLSSLVQDAVFPAGQMKWDRKSRRFGLLLNRFRWEAGVTPPERVQSILAIEDVIRVQVQGMARPDADTVLSVLSVAWQAAEDGMGRLILTLAGDGAVAVDVEALEVVLRDVTRPYVARSGKVPDHPA